jgi:hypothetical protein
MIFRLCSPVIVATCEDQHAFHELLQKVERVNCILLERKVHFCCFYFGKQVIFEGVRGTSYLGDIAIDDVSLTAGSCSQGIYLAADTMRVFLKTIVNLINILRCYCRTIPKSWLCNLHD